MADRLFRLRLSDSTTWAVVASTIAGARIKAEKYFPHEHVQIEESRDGGPWRLADAGCATCSPEQREILSNLGDYCEDSCGRRP